MIVFISYFKGSRALKGQHSRYSTHSNGTSKHGTPGTCTLGPALNVTWHSRYNTRGQALRDRRIDPDLQIISVYFEFAQVPSRNFMGVTRFGQEENNKNTLTKKQESYSLPQIKNDYEFSTRS